MVTSVGPLMSRTLLGILTAWTGGAGLAHRDLPRLDLGGGTGAERGPGTTWLLFSRDTKEGRRLVRFTEDSGQLGTVSFSGSERDREREGFSLNLAGSLGGQGRLTGQEWWEMIFLTL